MRKGEKRYDDETHDREEGVEPHAVAENRTEAGFQEEEKRVHDAKEKKQHVVVLIAVSNAIVDQNVVVVETNYTLVTSTGEKGRTWRRGTMATAQRALDPAFFANAAAVPRKTILLVQQRSLFHILLSFHVHTVPG